jgi:hypothetical protein
MKRRLAWRGENGFLQNEGIANELAARFYESRGLKAIRDAYARNARSCYLRWGADGKVRELDQHYPHITDEVTPRISSVEDARAQLQNVDFGAVINMHQAVSEEIVFNRLIERSHGDCGGARRRGPWSRAVAAKRGNAGCRGGGDEPKFGDRASASSSAHGG